MTLATWEWLGPAVAAALALLAGLWAWWRRGAPARRERQRRRDNAEIADDVRAAAGGDGDALDRLNDRLRQWMDEDD